MKTKILFVAGALVVVSAAVYRYWPAVEAPSPAPVPTAGVTGEAPPITNGAAGPEDLLGPDATASAPPIVYSNNEIVLDRSVPLKERLEDWVELANQDPSTAYDLSTSITSCAGVTQDVDKAERQLEAGGTGVRAAENTLDKQAYCLGLTKADFDASIDLMNSAASRGLVKAQEDYVYTAGAVIASVDGYEFESDRIAAFKRNSLNHLQNAARSGSTVALARLSEIYEQGTVVPADPELAARYFRSYLERSGNSSKNSQARLAQLEEQAKKPR